MLSTPNTRSNSPFQKLKTSFKEIFGTQEDAPKSVSDPAEKPTAANLKTF